MTSLTLIDITGKDGNLGNDFHGYKWTSLTRPWREDFLQRFLKRRRQRCMPITARSGARSREEKLDQFIGQKFGDGRILTAAACSPERIWSGSATWKSTWNPAEKSYRAMATRCRLRYMQEMADYDVPMAQARQTRTQSSQIGEIDPVVRRDGHEAQPNADMRYKAPEASRAHMVLDYALERFRTGYEYGRRRQLGYAAPQ